MADTKQPEGALPEQGVYFNADKFRALMAERDAARAQVTYWQKLASVWQDKAVTRGRERDVLRRELDAREGREPLTEGQIEREFWAREFPCVDTSHGLTVLSLYTQRIFYIKGWKAAHGIGDVGTSAEGETQHG